MKKSKISIRIAVLAVLGCLLGTFSHAQVDALYISSDANVGINNTAPNAKLHITDSDEAYAVRVYNSYGNSGTRVGIYNSMTPASAGLMIGNYNYMWYQPEGYEARGIYNYLYNLSGGTSGNLYGVKQIMYTRTSSTATGFYNYLSRSEGNSNTWGYYSYIIPSSITSASTYGHYSYISSSGSGPKYGVYSSVSTSQANWYAGYFNGDVHITGALTFSSDAKKKENIEKIDGALATVMQLSGKTYTFQNDETVNLATGKQYGLLAQDVEAVLPDLVKTVTNPGKDISKETPGEKGENGEVMMEISQEQEESEEYKSVNYLGMIPVLIEAVKEQQEIIEQQQKMIDELRAKIND